MRSSRLIIALALVYALALQALLAGVTGIAPAAAGTAELAWCAPASGQGSDERPAPAHHDIGCILACAHAAPAPALVPTPAVAGVPVAGPAIGGPQPLGSEPLSRRALSRLMPAPRAPPLA